MRTLLGVSCLSMSADLLNIVVACASQNVETMKQATIALEAIKLTGNFINGLLQIIGRLELDATVRLQAAIILKNEAKKRWDLPADEGGIPDSEKSFVRDNILVAHTHSERSIQRITLEVIYLISLNDFPTPWENLLVQLQNHLTSVDAAGRAVIVEVMDKIMSRYQLVTTVNEEILIELKDLVLPALFNTNSALNIVLLAQQSAEALLGSVNNTSVLTSDQVKMVVNVLKSCVTICCAICCIDIAEQIEDALPTLIPQLNQTLMISPTTAPLKSTNPSQPGILEDLQKTILEFYTTLINKYSEVSAKYAKDLTTASLFAVTRCSQFEGGDSLVASGVTLISAIATLKWGVEKDPFSESSALQELTDRVIIPNVMLRDCDEELFNESPSEFITRDLEDADQDTRRRAALDLIRAIQKDASRRVPMTSIVISRVQLLMQAPEAEYRQREAAICLVSALAAVTESRICGVTEMNKEFPFAEVLSAIVIPILGKEGVNVNPTLACASLKFIGSFRNQLSNRELTEILPVLAKHLISNDAAIRSYAAHAMEKVLFANEKYSQVDRFTTSNARLRSPEVLAQISSLVPHTLRAALNTSGDIPCDPEQMKLLWRTIAIIGRAPIDAANQTVECMESLITMATRIIGGHQKVAPKYHHFLFESLAVCIGILANAAQLDPSMAPIAFGKVQSSLLPTIMDVLSKGDADSDYIPYALQILQVILSCCTSPHASALIGAITPVLKPVLSASLWQSSKANAAALSALIVAFFERPDMHQELIALLPDVFARFKFALCTRKLEPFAFHVLYALIKNLSFEVWAPRYLRPLLSELLARLSATKGAIEIRARTFVAISTIICSNGPDILKTSMEVVNTLNAIRAGIAASLFCNAWVKTMASISNSAERRVCAIAFIACLSIPGMFPTGLTNESFAFGRTAITNIARLLSIDKMDLNDVKPRVHHVLKGDERNQVDVLTAAESYIGDFGSSCPKVSTSADGFETEFAQLQSCDPTVGRRNLAPRISEIEHIMHSPGFIELVKTVDGASQNLSDFTLDETNALKNVHLYFKQDGNGNFNA